MRVLDLFCGMGGWSDGFAREGFTPTGIDIEDWKYPYELIIQDIRDVDGTEFQGYEVIIGSPPCRDFSTATQVNKAFPGRAPPDPEAGLKLVHEFTRVVEEAKPPLWAMENVYRMGKFYDPKPIWRFYVSVRGLRSLWGNIPLGLTPDFRFPKRKMEFAYSHLSYRWQSAHRSRMPLNVARFVARACKAYLSETGILRQSQSQREGEGK